MALEFAKSASEIRWNAEKAALEKEKRGIIPRLPNISFHIKVAAHYKVKPEALFDEMLAVAQQLQVAVSGEHSAQNITVLPYGAAIVEVPWGEPRFRAFLRTAEGWVKKEVWDE